MTRLTSLLMELMTREVGTDRTPQHRYTRLITFGAMLFAGVQVLVMVTTASQNGAAIATLQLALVAIANGSGSAISPIIVQLMPLFMLTYSAEIITFGAALIFCWQAGKLIALFGGSPHAAAAAGRQLMWRTSLFWLVAMLAASVMLQRDGTAAWVVGTMGTVLLSSSAPPMNTVYTVHPTVVYLVIQTVMVLIQATFGMLGAVTAGAFAGRFGAASTARLLARETRPLPHSPAPQP